MATKQAAPQTITVGMEFEMLQVSPKCAGIVQELALGLRTDSSIQGMNGEELPKRGPGAPTELVTPVLEIPVEISAGGSYFNASQTTALDTASKLASCAAKVNSSCGFHLHLGRPNGSRTTWNPRRLLNVDGGPMSEWKPSHVRTMLAICLGLEARIFGCVPKSRRDLHHCTPIRQVYSEEDLLSYYVVNGLDARKYKNKQRYCWVNFVETRRPANPTEERIGYASSQRYGTIEIRALGETANPHYFAAWTELWIKIAAAVAYLPAESAILRCCYSSWLEPNFMRLFQLKLRHENMDELANRSVVTRRTAEYEEEH